MKTHSWRFSAAPLCAQVFTNLYVLRKEVLCAFQICVRSYVAQLVYMNGMSVPVFPLGITKASWAEKPLAISLRWGRVGGRSLLHRSPEKSWKPKLLHNVYMLLYQ